MDKNFLKKFNFCEDRSKSNIETLFSIIQRQKPDIHQRIPHLLIMAPDGAGTTTLTKEIAREMQRNYFFKIHGKEIFLELTLPKPENPLDTVLLDKFFSSPRIAASTQNKFYGLFLIDLSAWDGIDDFLNYRFNVLNRLLNFMRDNINNIYFCIRVKPDFQGKDKLEKMLKTVITLRKINMTTLGFSQCIQFIENEGLFLSPDAQNELLELENNHLTYRSLVLLTRELKFLLDASPSNTFTITQHNMQQAIEKCFTESDKVESKPVFGFR